MGILAVKTGRYTNVNLDDRIFLGVRTLLKKSFTL